MKIRIESTRIVWRINHAELFTLQNGDALLTSIPLAVGLLTFELCVNKAFINTDAVLCLTSPATLGNGQAYRLHLSHQGLTDLIENPQRGLLDFDRNRLANQTIELLVEVDFKSI